MKSRLALASLLLLLLAASGCASAPRGAGSPGVRCLGRPDTSGTQPLFYLFCIQSS